MTIRSQRLWLIGVCLLCISTGLALVLKEFRNNIVFFYTPSELKTLQLLPTKTIRIGGIVQKGSVVQTPHTTEIRFMLTDYNSTIEVSYHGILPNLFREEQGIVARGFLKDTLFYANELLAKHDEYYMPKEVADSLQDRGLWRPSSEKKQ